MEDFADRSASLLDQVAARAEREPLAALTMLGQLQRDVDDLRGQVVRIAAADASWAEIGDALGVSKQAAHQRYAKEWAKQLKGELVGETVTLKTALRTRDYDAAAAAERRRTALVEEFRKARAANRRRRA
jgi:hypothetical protein